MFKKLWRRHKKPSEPNTSAERANPEMSIAAGYMSTGASLSISPPKKRYRCSRGHEFEAEYPFDVTFTSNDWISKVYPCLRCMAEDLQAKYPPPEEVEPHE